MHNWAMHLLERNHTPTEFYYYMNRLYDVCTLYPLFFLTPPKINIEPENDALEDDFKNSIFHGCILRFQPLIFRGVQRMIPKIVPKIPSTQIQSPHFKKAPTSGAEVPPVGPLAAEALGHCLRREVGEKGDSPRNKVGAHERGNVSHHVFMYHHHHHHHHQHHHHHHQSAIHNTKYINSNLHVQSAIHNKHLSFQPPVRSNLADQY